MTQARLIVCTTCRAGHDLAEGETPPGVLLHAELERRLAASDAPLTLSSIACLAGCTRGCTAAFTMPGKWTYLLADLTPAQADDLIDYGAAYVASRSGA